MRIGAGGVVGSPERRRLLALTALAALLAVGAVAACGGQSGSDGAPRDDVGSILPGAPDAMLVLHAWDGGLLLVDPDTGDSRRLDLPIDVAAVAAGPAGMPLIVIEVGTATIYAVDDLDDPVSLRQVGDAPPGPLAAPVVSPDGRHLAAVMGEAESSQVVTVDLETGELTVVTEMAALEPEPTFACEPLGPVGGGPTAWPDLLVVDVWVPCEEVTFEATALIDPGAPEPVVEVHQGRLALSPGGDRYAAGTDGTAVVEWADGDRYEPDGGLAPVWSSARRLAYLETRPVPGASVFALMILEAGATEPTEVMRGHLTPLGWSPGGHVLVFWNADTGSLWRWDPDDGARDLELEQGRVVWAVAPSQ
jgi:hypothetical protein